MVSRKQVEPRKTLHGRCGTRLSATASASQASKQVLKGKIKKKYRWRPGTVCLREIRRYGTNTTPPSPPVYALSALSMSIANPGKVRD
jgi:hypothetical protein